MPLERLHNQNDLATFLGKQRGRNITIVSAFASGTTELLEAINNSNQVEVILGTINAFTSPSFIEAARTLLKNRLWVDFRGNASIHWKLYLISPSTVVVGSANFTHQGVGMGQDTCVVLKKKALYDDYIKQVDLLKRISRVLASGSADFDDAFDRHSDQHNRNQAALQAALQASKTATGTRTPKVLTFRDWAKQGFLTIPLFVWRDTHHDAVRKEASKLMRNAELVPRGFSEGGKRQALSGDKLIRDFLTEGIYGPSAPFDPGTIVLTMNRKGANMRFMQLDVIVRSERFKRDFMIERKKTRYPQPFELTTEVKAAIKHLLHNGQLDDSYAIPVDSLLGVCADDAESTVRTPTIKSPIT